jgi:hypothetical protein
MCVKQEVQPAHLGVTTVDYQQGEAGSKVLIYL